MNRRRVQQRRPKPWTLARVRRECPSAAAVYLALLDLAAERRTSLLTPTRKLLASMTGIKKHQTISQALTTLTRAGWIDLNHIPSSNRGQRTTLLRLILRRMHRKTVHIVSTEKRCMTLLRRGGDTKRRRPPLARRRRLVAPRQRSQPNRRHKNTRQHALNASDWKLYGHSERQESGQSRTPHKPHGQYPR